MELTDGVCALELSMDRGDEQFRIHPAAVETPKGLLLVDVGLPGQTDDLVAALDDHGFGLADVRAVVLTHHDGDHAGGLAAVSERADDPVVYAHEAAAPYVDGRQFPMKTDADAERYPAVPVDVELRDGVTFRTDAGPMRAVFTPGHAPGHLAFHFPDAGVLLAGDALRSEEGTLSGPSERFTPDRSEATRSVGRLAELDVSSILCYHGGPIEAATADIEAVYDSLATRHLD